MIIDGNKLIPSEGFAYVTNGEVYSTLVYLGVNDSAENWHDTNDEPPEPAEEPTVEDKAEAYDILMGVSE